MKKKKNVFKLEKIELNIIISKLLFISIFINTSKTLLFKIISSPSIGIIYFPLADKVPTHLVYSVPIFFLLFIILILLSSFCIFSINANVSGVEPSFAIIISKSEKF